MRQNQVEAIVARLEIREWEPKRRTVRERLSNAAGSSRGSKVNQLNRAHNPHGSLLRH